VEAFTLSYHNRTTFLSHEERNEKRFSECIREERREEKNINKMEDGFFENLFL
jgi:hypothetical protein